MPTPRGTILAACRALLRSRGYERFSMEGVASRAGYSRRTVYNQFTDRDQLYRASRIELIEEVEQGLQFGFAAGAPQPAIERFCSHAIDVFLHPSHQDLLASLAQDAEQAPWLRGVYDRRVRCPLLVVIERFLLELALQGRITAPDPARQAEWLLLVIEAVARPLATRSDPGVTLPVVTGAEIARLFTDRIGLIPAQLRAVDHPSRSAAESRAQNGAICPPARGKSPC